MMTNVNEAVVESREYSLEDSMVLNYSSLN